MHHFMQNSSLGWSKHVNEGFIPCTVTNDTSLTDTTRSNILSTQSTIQGSTPSGSAYCYTYPHPHPHIQESDYSGGYTPNRPNTNTSFHRVDQNYTHTTYYSVDSKASNIDLTVSTDISNSVSENISRSLFTEQNEVYDDNTDKNQNRSLSSNAGFTCNVNSLDQSGTHFSGSNFPPYSSSIESQDLQVQKHSFDSVRPPDNSLFNSRETDLENRIKICQQGKDFSNKYENATASVRRISVSDQKRNTDYAFSKIRSKSLYNGGDGYRHTKLRHKFLSYRSLSPSRNRRRLSSPQSRRVNPVFSTSKAPRLKWPKNNVNKRKYNFGGLKHDTPKHAHSKESFSKDKEEEKNKAEDQEQQLKKEQSIWTRSAPADLYYKPESLDVQNRRGTQHLAALCDEFEEKLLKRAEVIRSELPKYEPFDRKKRIKVRKHVSCEACSGSSCCSDEESESEPADYISEVLEHKRKHPLRLHRDLWFNEPGEMNDGPLCKCSARARRSGIQHNIYAGENHLAQCDPNSNNADKLFHYRVTLSPPTNFLLKTPTVIEHDANEYIFEGFSIFSHKKLEELPLCKFIRFDIEYTIFYFEEEFPKNFTVRELNLFYTYLFKEVLELADLDLHAHGDSTGCPQYHFMPRFVRQLLGNGKEILSMNEVLRYLLNSFQPLVPVDRLLKVLKMNEYEWQSFTESVRGMIVTYPGKKPSSLRVDQLDRNPDIPDKPRFPEIIHFGIRPLLVTYARNPEYQKARREYIKLSRLVANMPKPSPRDKRKLESKQIHLQKLRTKDELKPNVTVAVSSEHFSRTGIMCDIVQHAMLLPVLVSHLRFHRSLNVLEEKIRYKFKNRYLLQLALTHPSYKDYFGTNPDHARNSLSNCGIRQPVYGGRRIRYKNTRKKGLNSLNYIMSGFGKSKETESSITHNERLEFLGDAVIEFVTSVHLFHIFPNLEEGGLTTYRTAIVENQHLNFLAKTIGLEEFMLYSHGIFLCHDSERQHVVANCFEALMGALFLDEGVATADRVLGEVLFKGDEDLLSVWINLPPHPLQQQEPLGDRKWIPSFPFLQKITEFEESAGLQFTHIRLLARAFTHRSIGFNNLTLGSNERLEFLGDTVLNLITSEFLYKFFPKHREGHLTLLRSSLVSNYTQAVICDDLGMVGYTLYSNQKSELQKVGKLKTKDKADLVEALLGALYIDKGLEHCRVFCSVCFFPRLKYIIVRKVWNDPKSKLQQCCLTLRTTGGGEPDTPVYKVIQRTGPEDSRIFTVAVYFKGKRLAKATGHTIFTAEMNAAERALKNSKDLFQTLDQQKHTISKSTDRQEQNSNNKRSEKR